MRLHGFPPLLQRLWAPIAGWLSLRAATAGFIALVCVFFVGIELFRAWEERNDATARASLTTENLTRSVAQHATDTVRGVDVALVGLVDALRSRA
jgi:hypothetical protein